MKVSVPSRLKHLTKKLRCPCLGGKEGQKAARWSQFITHLTALRWCLGGNSQRRSVRWCSGSLPFMNGIWAQIHCNVFMLSETTDSQCNLGLLLQKGHALSSRIWQQVCSGGMGWEGTGIAKAPVGQDWGASAEDRVGRVKKDGVLPSVPTSLSLIIWPTSSR